MGNKGWKFLRPGGTLSNDQEGKTVHAGDILRPREAGPVILYRRGIHYCPLALDALDYAQSTYVVYVMDVGRDRVEDGDLVVTDALRALCDPFDAASILYEFARENAGRMLTHAYSPRLLTVKRRWLSGQATDEDLAAAKDEARGTAKAAWDAAWDLAGEAVAAPARDAAWMTATDLANTAAWGAIWAATFDVAWDSNTEDPAEESVRSETFDAAWLSAWGRATWEKAWKAAWHEQSERLEALLLAKAQSNR